MGNEHVGRKMSFCLATMGDKHTETNTPMEMNHKCPCLFHRGDKHAKGNKSWMSLSIPQGRQTLLGKWTVNVLVFSTGETNTLRQMNSECVCLFHRKDKHNKRNET